MRMVVNWADIASISRMKSWAANRPSPSAFGGVFDVAATRDAGCDELGEKASHQAGVARVIQLELVDADELGTREQGEGLLIAERADQRRVLDEGAEVLALRGELPEGGEQVGLADAEAAVEIDARTSIRRAPAREQSAGRLPRRGELANGGDGGRLARVVVVGAVGVEGGVVELPRRHEVRDDLLPGESGNPLGEVMKDARGIGRHDLLLVEFVV